MRIQSPFQEKFRSRSKGTAIIFCKNLDVWLPAITGHAPSKDQSWSPHTCTTTTQQGNTAAYNWLISSCFIVVLCPGGIRLGIPGMFIRGRSGGLVRGQSMKSYPGIHMTPSNNLPSSPKNTLPIEGKFGCKLPLLGNILQIHEAQACGSLFLRPPMSCTQELTASVVRRKWTWKAKQARTPHVKSEVTNRKWEASTDTTFIIFKPLEQG